MVRESHDEDPNMGGSGIKRYVPCKGLHLAQLVKAGPERELSENIIHTARHRNQARYKPSRNQIDIKHTCITRGG